MLSLPMSVIGAWHFIANMTLNIFSGTWDVMMLMGLVTKNAHSASGFRQSAQSAGQERVRRPGQGGIVVSGYRPILITTAAMISACFRWPSP